MRKGFPKTSAKVIYDFCKSSSDPYLQKVKHKDIRKYPNMLINKCYSAMFVHGKRKHVLLDRLRDDMIGEERVNDYINFILSSEVCQKLDAEDRKILKENLKNQDSEDLRIASSALDIGSFPVLLNRIFKEMKRKKKNERENWQGELFPNV